MNLIKSGISNEVLIGECHKCNAVQSATRKELNFYLLYDGDKESIKKSVGCIECGNTVTMYTISSPKGKELEDKYITPKLMDKK